MNENMSENNPVGFGVSEAFQEKISGKLQHHPLHKICIMDHRGKKYYDEINSRNYSTLKNLE
jgi:hypothetical protein